MLISLEESDFYQNTFNLATIYLWVYDVSYTCSRHFLINDKDVEKLKPSNISECKVIYIITWQIILAVS